MQILGAWLAQNGATQPSYLHRVAKADKAFWADSAVFLIKNIPLCKLFERYSERVACRVLHGCGSWAWSQSLCRAVWEGKALRRTVCAARKADDTWLRRFQRTSRAAKKAYIKGGSTPLTKKVLRSIHRTAAFLQPPNPDRFPAAASTTLLLSDATE